MSGLGPRVAAEVSEAAARLVRAANTYGVRDPNELLYRAGQMAAEQGLSPLDAIARVRAELDDWWREVSA